MEEAIDKLNEVERLAALTIGLLSIVHPILTPTFAQNNVEITEPEIDSLFSPSPTKNEHHSSQPQEIENAKFNSTIKSSVDEPSIKQEQTSNTPTAPKSATENEDNLPHEVSQAEQTTSNTSNQNEELSSIELMSLEQKPFEQESIFDDVRRPKEIGEQITIVPDTMASTKDPDQPVHLNKQNDVHNDTTKKKVLLTSNQQNKNKENNTTENTSPSASPSVNPLTDGQNISDQNIIDQTKLVTPMTARSQDSSYNHAPRNRYTPLNKHHPHDEHDQRRKNKRLNNQDLLNKNNPITKAERANGDENNRLPEKIQHYNVVPNTKLVRNEPDLPPYITKVQKDLPDLIQKKAITISDNGTLTKENTYTYRRPKIAFDNYTIHKNHNTFESYSIFKNYNIHKSYNFHKNHNSYKNDSPHKSYSIHKSRKQLSEDEVDNKQHKIESVRIRANNPKNFNDKSQTSDSTDTLTETSSTLAANDSTDSLQPIVTATVTDHRFSTVDPTVDVAVDTTNPDTSAPWSKPNKKASTSTAIFSSAIPKPKHYLPNSKGASRSSDVYKSPDTSATASTTYINLSTSTKENTHTRVSSEHSQKPDKLNQSIHQNNIHSRAVSTQLGTTTRRNSYRQRSLDEPLLNSDTICIDVTIEKISIITPKATAKQKKGAAQGTKKKTFISLDAVLNENFK